MYSFSSFTPNELMEKYKRQTYLIAFPIGMMLSVLYKMNVASSRMQIFLANIIFIELGLFLLLILFAPPLKYAMEVVFCFSIPVYVFIVTEVQIDLSIVNFPNQAVLGNPVNGLSMWLIIFLIGAFLSLRPGHIRMFILFLFTGMIVLAAHNLWMLYSIKELRVELAYIWANAFIGLAVATLLVQRIGLLQQRNASTDALTGVLNRHALYPLLTQELDRSVRYGRSFSIILFDLDEFKAVNDTFGHLEGDKVLKEFSKLVGGLLRKADHVGRWGGEEFLLILPETDGVEAQILAGRIRLKIEETEFVEKYHVTASFSVAAYRMGQSLETLLECADKALYQAKHNGRNQVVVFQEELG